ITRLCSTFKYFLFDGEKKITARTQRYPMPVFPHPLEHKIIICVQTAPDYSPQEAFFNAITLMLISKLSLLEKQFGVAIKDKQEGIE
uniref:Uncharacterized protein n=1 Tax=Monodelphis domestica TaxID=13616 RepID=A0A5F8GMT7_MONDO